ncbi:hypothetical protein [Changchengzhania lutea]|nr:hypothetical protein [Changchengzhania lutea]
MKSLKIILIVTVLFASLTSCVKQDLNEDEMLVAEPTETTYTGGGVNEGE